MRVLGKDFWDLDDSIILRRDGARSKRQALRAVKIPHPEAAGLAGEGMRSLRRAKRTGPYGQEKKDEPGKCEVERRDEGNERKRRHDLEETKGRRGPSRPGGRRRQWVGSPEHRRFIFKSSRCLRVK